MFERLSNTREFFHYLQNRIYGQSWTRYPKCDFPLLGLNELRSFIEGRIVNREATSIIRLGDGEGLVLAEPDPSQVPSWGDIKLHFGPDITERDVLKLSEGLKSAIASADAVGVRSDIIGVTFPDSLFKVHEQDFLTAVRKHFCLRDVERDLLQYPGALRLAFLHRILKNAMFSDAAVFFNAWAHYYLSKTGVLVTWILKEKRIGIISSKTEIINVLQASLPELHVDFYPVPEMYMEADPKFWWPHFPDRFDELINELVVVFPGQLFLVGAGICGKVYCDKIKRLGGIAIDIGAVCDAWVDIASRPRAFQSLYNNYQSGVPDDLLLEKQLSTMTNKSFEL